MDIALKGLTLNLLMRDIQGDRALGVVSFCQHVKLSPAFTVVRGGPVELWGGGLCVFLGDKLFFRHISEGKLFFS